MAACKHRWVSKTHKKCKCGKPITEIKTCKLCPVREVSHSGHKC